MAIEEKTKTETYWICNECDFKYYNKTSICDSCPNKKILII